MGLRDGNLTNHVETNNTTAGFAGSIPRISTELGRGGQIFLSPRFAGNPSHAVPEVHVHCGRIVGAGSCPRRYYFLQQREQRGSYTQRAPRTGAESKGKPKLHSLWDEDPCKVERWEDRERIILELPGTRKSRSG